MRHALLLCVLLLATRDVSAHSRLARSEPKDAATLEVAPAAVELWFDGAIERRFHKLSLRAPDGKQTPLEGAVDDDDARHVRAALPPLAPGRWEVRWDVVSRDGHRVAGRITFLVE